MNKDDFQIGIIGLGYVGLPLAIEFSKKFKTVGYDINSTRIDELNDNVDSTLEISSKKLKNSKAILTSEKGDISNSNIFIITVPTPIDKFNNPNLKPLKQATELVAGFLDIGDIVIYESTVFPGATEELCVPILENLSSLRYNKDFFCGYSPERINPGDKEHSLVNIKKITSGSNSSTALTVDKLYKTIIKAGTYLASSIKVAEAAKVIENVQRDVNIALVNELSMIFNKLEIDTGDVLEAAGTKWNFLKFSPGLVGGHCIGVDPYYLTHKSKEIGYHPEMILAGRRINDSMGEYVAKTTLSQMVKAGINPIGANVVVLGLTFKENCPDLRNTKVPDIIKYLEQYKCNILAIDPYVDKYQVKKTLNLDIKFDNNIKFENTDVVIIAVSHTEFLKITLDEWSNKINQNGVLVDIKNAYEKNFFDNSQINHWRL